MPDSFRGFLAASLAAVKREAPPSARAIAAALGPARVALVVDGGPVILRGGTEVTIEVTIEVAIEVASDAVTASGAEPEVRVATTASALLALLDGSDELYPAIVDNRVRVRAAPGDAERLFEAMRRFVEGCARTSVAPELLAAYRRRVRGDAGPNLGRRT